MNWQTSVWKDGEEMSGAAADELARVAQAAARGRGRFDLALAGGRTPQRLYQILAAEYRSRIDWSRTHLFWGDERYVAPDDPLSNWRMARQALIDPLGMVPANLHPLPTGFADPDEAARAYEETLRAHFGPEAPRFDLALLGIGPEGHTASLFPGSPALAENRRWVVPVRVDAQPPLRLTLTLVALDAATDVFFLVSGEDKRPIVSKLLSLGPEELSAYPAAMVRPRGRRILFLDRAAQP